MFVQEGRLDRCLAAGLGYRTWSVRGRIYFISDLLFSLLLSTTSLALHHTCKNHCMPHIVELYTCPQALTQDLSLSLSPSCWANTEPESPSWRTFPISTSYERDRNVTYTSLSKPRKASSSSGPSLSPLSLDSAAIRSGSRGDWL